MSNLEIVSLKRKINDQESRLTNLESTVDTVGTEFSNHEILTTGAHEAQAINLSPVAGLSSTDLQSAIDELLSEIQNHNNDASAHAASNISTDELVIVEGNDVQTILENLEQLEIDNFNTVQTRIDNLTAGQIAANPPVGRSFTQVQQAIDVLNYDIVAILDDVGDHETQITQIMNTLLNSGIDENLAVNLKTGQTGFTGIILPLTPPGSPQQGSTYFDPPTDKLFIHNGTSWVSVQLT